MTTAPALPRLGQEVTLVLRNFTAFKDAAKTFTLVGTVTRLPAHPDQYSEDSFGLLVPRTEIPQRVVRLRDVQRINGKAIKYTPHLNPQFTVSTYMAPSTDGKTFYKVIRRGGQWGCTCQGFSYRRECRHINNAQAGKYKES